MQAAQTSPLNFFEPKVFHPERFLPESHPLYDSRFATDNREAFKPFSTGPRSCMGGKYVYSTFSRSMIVDANLLTLGHSWHKLELHLPEWYGILRWSWGVRMTGTGQISGHTWCLNQKLCM